MGEIVKSLQTNGLGFKMAMLCVSLPLSLDLIKHHQNNTCYEKFTSGPVNTKKTKKKDICHFKFTEDKSFCLTFTLA